MECFFSILQRREVSRDGENRMVWMESKNETFSVKSLYSALELGRSIPFPMAVIWNSLVLSKVSFFFLRRLAGKGIDVRSPRKESVVFCEQLPSLWRQRRIY